MKTLKLKMLPIREYVGVNRDDPIRFYTVPIIGGLYRRRIELCLGELRGGESVLEIGFGSGVTFINLHDMYREIYGLDLTADAEKVQDFFCRRSIETHLQNGNILQMPYDGNIFDAVLLISILEHLQPEDLAKAFREIRRILKPGGQVVYGVPIERPLMVFLFRLLRTNIREHHFSTEKDVLTAACGEFKQIQIIKLRDPFRLLGTIYQVGHFVKE
jgi:ubiquinone/menaquinone biosynthesis C-methylase UbiE